MSLEKAGDDVFLNFDHDKCSSAEIAVERDSSTSRSLHVGITANLCAQISFLQAFIRASLKCCSCW